MKMRYCLSLATVYGLLYATAGLAQSAVSEDFTGTTTNSSWYYSGGACLTAKTAAGTGTEFTFTTSGAAGQIPGCTAIQGNSDAYGGETLYGGMNSNGIISSSAPDPANQGALRFTNGGSGGFNQFGAIISGSPFASTAGVQVTFKTVTYRGNSGGSAGDGADGISFFLMDASVAPNVGSYGGSLAYTCSLGNNKYGYNGMIGAYIGLGIDEYGNFLNGVNNTLGETVNYTNGPDNTASGGTYQPNRIGMRGAGNVNWTWLNSNYSSYYPSSLNASSQNSAVQSTCTTGTLWDYNPSHTGTPKDLGSRYPVLDYAAIPNAYKVLSGVTIANESATLRSSATPILYKLKITSSGLLSLWYSYNGGAYQSVLTNQNITSSNGALPSNLRFGFAGSTGGSTNIHEVLCFKAAAADTASGSAASNQTQSSRVTSTTQAYFAYYDPNDWTGRLTANAVSSDSSGNLTIATQAKWDASCVLTGVASGATCPTTGVAGVTAAEAPSSRVVLTWNDSTNAGVAFNYSSSLTTNMSLNEQNSLNIPLSILAGSAVTNFLRGDRTNEVNAAGVGLFRDRDYVLGDIINSSPVAIGQPVSPYAINWSDKLNTSTTMPENSGALCSTTPCVSYAAFTTNNVTRQNMVYVGANDGMLHGFRAGAFDSTNTFQQATNDGTEMLAYVPSATITGGSVSAAASSALLANNCTGLNATLSTAQTIRGETPGKGGLLGAPACFQPTLDYTNTQYGHNFFVDATPGTGDLFYGTSATNATWHTWLVGGLGAGGAAIYALDITTPANFAETNAASLVVGEWNTSNISCVGDSGTNLCANSLGNTYGTPIIRRLHNGTWGVIWGNGLGSSSGDAGVFIMTINPTTAAKNIYYLSTGKSSTTSPDGIAYVTSADLDGDHITDYLYAGDLLGNVWRFDLTSSTATNWGVSSPNGSTTTAYPIFAAGATHPITSSVVVAVVNGNVSGTQIMIAFGTGQKTPLTNTTSAGYSSAAQSLYAFWDWNMSSWNSLSPTNQYASLTASRTATGLSSPFTEAPSNLTAQTLTLASNGNVDISSTAICWKSGTSCTSGSSFGWSAALPSTGEQVIYNPQLVGGAFNVNSVIPASNSLLSCTTTNDSGFSYLIQLATGTVATPATGYASAFKNVTTYNSSTGLTTTVLVTDATAAAVATNATGTSMIMTTSSTQASSTIAAGGTGSSISCPLGGGACTNLGAVSGLVSYPSPFASVTGCGNGNTNLVGLNTSANAQSVGAAVACPLSGSRVTRTVLR